MDIDAKIAEGKRYKDAGNQLFKEGKFRKALSKYATVLAYVYGLPGSKKAMQGITRMAANRVKGDVVTTAQEEEASELEKLTYQNMAVCHLRLNSPKDALVYCGKALAIDPKSWKAYLRKGEAYLMLQDFDSAKGWLDCAAAAINATMQPNPSESRRAQEAVTAVAAAALQAVERERQRMHAMQKEYDSKQRKKFANMFRGGSSSGSSSANEGSGNGKRSDSTAAGSGADDAGGSGSSSSTGSSSGGHRMDMTGDSVSRMTDGWLGAGVRPRCPGDVPAAAAVRGGTASSSSGGGSHCGNGAGGGVDTAGSSVGSSRSAGGSPAPSSPGPGASSAESSAAAAAGSGSESGSGRRIRSGRRVSRATATGNDEES